MMPLWDSGWPAQFPEQPPTPSPEDSSPPEEPTTISFPRRPWRDPENGRPFFPLAWYDLGRDEADLDEMAQRG